MIYTSNYARKGNSPTAIAISVKPPSWYNGSTLPILAPTWEIVIGSKSGTISHEEYRSAYIDLIRSRDVNFQQLMEQWNQLGDVFLLCYESPRDFCHRHIVAELIEHDTGIQVTEWMNAKEQAAHTQNTLVDNLLTF